MLDAIAAELTHSFSNVPATASAVRLVMAASFGGIIGFEREWRRKPAGLRTHILVAVAAALFIVISQELGSLQFGDAQRRLDPLRLIEAVTAGVAFLAAGTIISAGGRVRNVTTGASMWLAGAVGLACGAGLVPLAAMATGIVLVVLVVLRATEKLMGTHD